MGNGFFHCGDSKAIDEMLICCEVIKTLKGYNAKQHLGVMKSTPMLDYKGTQGKFVWKIRKETLASLLSRIAAATTLILLFLLFFNQVC